MGRGKRREQRLEPKAQGLVDSRFDDRKDPLGARMKERYEFATRTHLPRRSWVVIRVDGRNFSRYTRGLEKPYDPALMEAMGRVTELLCAQVAGCQLGYCQSDEISLLLTDFAAEGTEPWFGGSVQKIASVAASLATAHFNRVFHHPQSNQSDRLAVFDARVFALPSAVEAANYLLWRQQDAYRNAISMVGQAAFSPRELERVSTRALREKLLAERAVAVDDLPQAFLRGQVVERVTVMKPVEYIDKRTEERVVSAPVERRVWERQAAPEFRGLGWLLARIPRRPEDE